MMALLAWRRHLWAGQDAFAFLWRRTHTEQQVLSPPPIVVCCRLLDRSSRCRSFGEKNSKVWIFPAVRDQRWCRPSTRRLQMDPKGGLMFEGKCIFENKPPPQSRSCLLLKKGGAYFREDTVLVHNQAAHIHDFSKVIPQLWQHALGAYICEA